MLKYWFSNIHERRSPEIPNDTACKIDFPVYVHRFSRGGGNALVAGAARLRICFVSRRRECVARSARFLRRTAVPPRRVIRTGDDGTAEDGITRETGFRKRPIPVTVGVAAAACRGIIGNVRRHAVRSGQADRIGDDHPRIYAGIRVVCSIHTRRHGMARLTRHGVRGITSRAVQVHGMSTRSDRVPPNGGRRRNTVTRTAVFRSAGVGMTRITGNLRRAAGVIRSVAALTRPHIPLVCLNGRTVKIGGCFHRPSRWMNLNFRRCRCRQRFMQVAARGKKYREHDRHQKYQRILNLHNRSVEIIDVDDSTRRIFVRSRRRGARSSRCGTYSRPLPDRCASFRVYPP